MAAAETSRWLCCHKTLTARAGEISDRQVLSKFRGSSLVAWRRVAAGDEILWANRALAAHCDATPNFGRGLQLAAAVRVAGSMWCAVEQAGRQLAAQCIGVPTEAGPPARPSESNGRHLQQARPGGGQGVVGRHHWQLAGCHIAQALPPFCPVPLPHPNPHHPLGSSGLLGLHLVFSPSQVSTRLAHWPPCCSPCSNREGQASHRGSSKQRAACRSAPTEWLSAAMPARQLTQPDGLPADIHPPRQCSRQTQ